MIQIRIPAEDMEVLEEERYTHPHPRVQRKLHTLYWVGLGYPHPRRGAHYRRV
jgi:excinuclease UvrABC ATPase subunit